MFQIPEDVNSSTPVQMCRLQNPQVKRIEVTGWHRVFVEILAFKIKSAELSRIFIIFHFSLICYRHSVQLQVYFLDLLRR